MHFRVFERNTVGGSLDSSYAITVGAVVIVPRLILALVHGLQNASR